jgi:hypothetical protein
MFFFYAFLSCARCYSRVDPGTQEISGTLPGRSRPRRRMSEPIRPSVWRHEVKHHPGHQHRQNGQRRIPWLATAVRPRFGPPGGDRLLAEPHRQIAMAAQGCLVGRPIRQPTLLFRDMEATLGVGLERHGGQPGSGLERAFYPTQPRRQTSYPCNAPWRQSSLFGRARFDAIEESGSTLTRLGLSISRLSRSLVRPPT